MRKERVGCVSISPLDSPFTRLCELNKFVAASFDSTYMATCGYGGCRIHHAVRIKNFELSAQQRRAVSR